MNFKGQIKLFIFIVIIIALCVFLRLYMDNKTNNEVVEEKPQEVEVIKENNDNKEEDKTTTTTKAKKKSKKNKKIANNMFEDITEDDYKILNAVVSIEQEEYKEETINIETSNWENYDPIVDPLFDPINVKIDNNLIDEVDNIE